MLRNLEKLLPAGPVIVTEYLLESQTFLKIDRRKTSINMERIADKTATIFKYRISDPEGYKSPNFRDSLWFFYHKDKRRVYYTLVALIVVVEYSKYDHSKPFRTRNFALLRKGYMRRMLTPSQSFKHTKGQFPSGNYEFTIIDGKY